LEEVLQEPEAKEEAQEFVSEAKPEKPIQEEVEQYPVASSPFRPYAKDVEAQIKVLEDPTGQLSSNGTVGEFLEYFQDRFKRTEKLLRQRMDLKAATPISEALKAQHKSKLKIIGMVTEKREAKQQQLITIED
jgi:DNA polymerase II small subunit/DNA polymerase delta subunit B